MFATLALQLLLDVLNRDVIMAFQSLLLRHASQLVDFSLGAEGVGLAAPLLHLRTHLQHLFLLLTQSLFQLIVFGELNAQGLIKVDYSVLGNGARRAGARMTNVLLFLA